VRKIYVKYIIFQFDHH